MTPAWLRCRPQPSAFSDELIVTITTRHGARRVYDVPKSEVAGNWVRVQAEERDSVMWVHLPTAHRGHPITVPEKSLIFGVAPPAQPGKLVPID
jgi:hypothetical protein